jgi:hypothetical protein
MSIDTTFQPKTESISFTNAAALQVPGDMRQIGVTTFRVTNTGATGTRFSWGSNSSVAAPAAAGVNTMWVGPGLSVYIEVPGNSYFIGAASSTFDVIGGQGGIGG